MKEEWVYKTLGECCDILDSKRKPGVAPDGGYGTECEWMPK